MGKLILVKKAKFATLFKNEQDQKFVKLENCRASYPYLGTPSSDKSDDGTIVRKYKVVFQLPKGSHDEAKDLVKSVILELCEQNKSNVDPSLWFLKNGDKSEREEDHGFWLVSVSERKTRPKVLDRRADEVTDIARIDDMMYGGCWINGIIRPWFFGGQAKSKPGAKLKKQVLCGFESTQFLRDDTPYGRSRIDDSDAYDSVEDGDGMEETATADDGEL